MPARVATLFLAVLLALAPAVSAQSLDRAKQLFDEARYVDAKKELLAVQKAEPRNAVVAYYLGRTELQLGDTDEAIGRLETAVELDDRNSLYHYWLGSALGEAAQRANPLRQPFLARRTKGELERAVELDPDHLDARFALVQFFALAPAVMGGGVDRARDQAAELGKRNAMRGAMARGVIAGIEKDYAAEAVAYQQAITAAPDESNGYFALAANQARSGKHTEAFATLDQYIKRKPDDRAASYQVGRIAAITGKHLERGEAALRQFLATPPRDTARNLFAGAHYWLGQIAEKQGKKDAARDYYQTALKLNPRAQQARKALDALK